MSTTSTTNNFFKNDLSSNLMIVSGETTTTSYTATNFSDKVDDVIKIVFNDTFRGNFRTAYDPLNREEGHLGFRDDSGAVVSADYSFAKNFRVKQIDGATGSVIAEGIALRWVPGSKEYGGGTLFIKELFHNSAPSHFSAENGVIFCNEINPFTYDSVTYSANPMWAGSSIKAIQTASNVYKLTTDEVAEAANSGTATNKVRCLSDNKDYTVGIGSFEYGQRVVLKTAGTFCDNQAPLGIGTVLASVIDSTSGILSVFVEFDSPLNDALGQSGNCTNCSTYLCVGDSANSCASSCCRYGVATARKISTPECGTVQKIIFGDEVGSNYIPGRELYQWKWDAAGNHASNTTQVPNGSDTEYKITGEYLYWDSSAKILILLAPSKLFEIKYGNVYQKDENNNLISRGSAISTNLSKFIRKSGSFINIKNTSSFSTYVSGNEYYQGWPATETGITSGEYLVQTTQSESTSYNPDYTYTVGETVIQPLTENSSGVITDYAAGKVVSWEPNTTSLSSVASKLVIKRYEYGTTDPKQFETNNTLIPKTKQLARFRIGAISTEGGSGTLTILNRSQRNILPLRIFKNINVATGQISWYDFSSDTVKQASITTEVLDPAETETNDIVGTIVRGSSIGTTRTKAIEADSGSVYKIHLMDTNVYFGSIISLSDVTQIGISGTETSNNITYPKIYPVFNAYRNTDVNGKMFTSLYEPLVDKMITPLPGGLVIENVTSGDANFGSNELIIQQFYNVTFNSNTEFVDIKTNVPSAEFVNTFGSTYSFATDSSGNSIKLIKYVGLKDTDELSIFPSDTTSVYYDVLQETVSGSQKNKRLVIRRKPGTGAIPKIVLGAEVKCVASSVVKNKQKVQFTETAQLRYQSSGEFAGKWVAELSNYDVSEIISVFFKGSGTIFISNNKKDLFGIASRVNDYSYQKPLLVLGSNGVKENTNTDISQGPISAQIPIYGIFTNENNNYYVEVSVTAIGSSISENTAGLITRESYKDFIGSQLTIKDIPYYKSKVDGAQYHASSILDSRPLINSSNDVGNTKFVVLPQSSTINTTLSVYFPRKDVLYINKNGEFKIVYGQTAEVPSYPTLPEDGMVLYNIDKPSYIFSQKDLTLRYTDNRRYTMKDIGRIEKRVQQLEEYSTLSLLEKNADSFLVQDTSGNNRFKNGILVDPFENHKIGDTAHPDYNVAIDAEVACARPKFNNEVVPLLPIEYGSQQFIKVLNTKTGVTSGVENGSISTGLYMMPFTEMPFVIQPQATRSMTVTPFEVVQSEGILRLTPREDDWVDTTVLPEVNVNLAGDNDVWEDIADEMNASRTGPFGMHYGNWKTISKQVTKRKFKKFINGRHGKKSRWRETKTVTTQQREVTGDILKSTTDTVSLGDRVVNVGIIPYMRARRIRVFVTGMKPNARIYPFFDGIDVSQYCYAYDSIAQIDAAYNSTLDPTKRFTNTSIIQKTNGNGNAFIIFDMPGATFRTGDRKFSISDSQINDYTRASTFATGTYSAYGLSQERQTTNATVRDFEVQSVNTTEQRTRTTVFQKRLDPLAQTFVINKELYPDGIFLSSIDLFFARKPSNDTNIPIKVEIRPTVNGFPDINKIYPGAVCILNPSQVNVSDYPAANNAQSVTKFVFESPVYLEPGEHSFVVRSTTEEYEIYIAEIGQPLVNSTQKVTEQPYVGVFFSSSNASTWLPQPSMDMMMTLNKCKFPTNTAYTFTTQTGSVGKTLQYELLNFNNTYQEFDSAKISWTMMSVLGGVETPIDANSDIPYTSPQTLADGSSLYFTATAITTNEDICPVINTERMSLFAVHNLIENNTNVEINGELDAYASDIGTVKRARYITKIVTLEDGFESNNFKLILSVNKPIGTKVQAFIKYQTIEQTKNFHDNEYVQLTPKMGTSAFDSYYTQYEDDFVDVQFDLPSDSPVEFNRFAIKICLYSDNAAYVPRIKDLRGIAVL